MSDSTDAHHWPKRADELRWGHMSHKIFFADLMFPLVGYSVKEAENLTAGALSTSLREETNTIVSFCGNKSEKISCHCGMDICRWRTG